MNYHHFYSRKEVFCFQENLWDKNCIFHLGKEQRTCLLDLRFLLPTWNEMGTSEIYQGSAWIPGHSYSCSRTMDSGSEVLRYKYLFPIYSP